MASSTNINAKEIQQQQQHAQRLFLYIRMKTMESKTIHISQGGKLEIHLSHAKGTLTKLEDHYPTENIIDLSVFDSYKPTFSLTIEQDNIEDMNILSDNPLLLTLYERVRLSMDKKSEISENGEQEVKDGERRIKDKEKEVAEEEQAEDYAEQLIPIAQGYIDLLKLYTKKRELATFRCFLYTISLDQMHLGTFITTWEVYALLPLLKELTIHNIINITFESIFNVPPTITDIADNLVADVYFESNRMNTNKQYQRVKFCTFRKEFNVPNSHILELKWETLKNRQLNNYDCLGIHCGNSVNTCNLFRHLVYGENSPINVENVNLNDAIITSNSTHRYVLTTEFVRKLEDVLAFNEQHLLIELYRADEPNVLLARGYIDASILLYPEVNSTRFAVHLLHENNKSPPPTKAKAKPNKKSAANTTNFAPAASTQQPMFAIISVCFLSPITEAFVPISMERSIAKCNAINKSVKYKSIGQRLEAHYQFEMEIKHLINYIINNDLKENAENAAAIGLRCQQENLMNRLFKLIACDFNINKPTKDSIEFHNLMTDVYKFAEQCTYDMLKKLGDNLPNTVFMQDNKRIIGYCSAAQYITALGETHFAQCFWEKAEKLAAHDTHFQFLKLVRDVENRDLKQAKTYYALPKNQQFAVAQHLTDLIQIYIKYVETLRNEQTFNEAMENLIVDLREEHLAHFPKDIIAWVLLHCIFKYCGYKPGISYTRWRYEHLETEVKVTLPIIPTSRYNLLNSCNLMLSASASGSGLRKQQLHLDVFDLMTHLGLYKFGEFIFRELQQDCTPLERYITQTTLKILMNEIPTKYPAKTFPSSKGKNKMEQLMENACLLITNGHLEYARGEFVAAMQYYGEILNMHNHAPNLDCSLAFLRYGFYMLNHDDGQQCERAVEAFNKCQHSHVQFIASFGLGKAYFKLQTFKEAETAFAKCTTFKIHIPEVWGYLALINLLQKHNYKALESWKYAKISPNNEFSLELQQHLANVNIDEVELVVDIPSASD